MLKQEDRNELVGLGILTIIVNVTLMFVKIITGVVGHSYALIADGIESASDILSSLITWAGFHLSLKPAIEALLEKYSEEKGPGDLPSERDSMAQFAASLPRAALSTISMCSRPNTNHP